MEYKVEDVNIGPLMRNYNAFHAEKLIQNSTQNNIVVIDSDNNKTVIPTVSASPLGRECVVIWYRVTTSPTVDNNNCPIMMAGKQITLQKHDLNTDGGCYIPEINMVLCTEAAAITATHPRSSITYIDATHEALDTIAKTLNDSPTIKMTANDPDGRYNKIYTVIGDINIEIPVTAVYGEAVLQITYFNCGECKCYSVDLDAFFNSENDVMDVHELPITFLTTNKARASRYVKDYKRIPQSEVDELLKRAEQRAAKDHSAIKNQYDADISTKTSEIKRLKEQAKVLTAERDDAERKASELKAAVDANNVLRETSVKTQELNAKERLSNNNVDISNNDVRTSDAKRSKEETEAQFKLYHLALAAAIPTVALIGMKAYDSYMKSRPQDFLDDPLSLLNIL